MCLPNLVRISKKCFLLILFVWWRVRYQETALFSGVSCFRAMPISSLSLAVSLSLILSMELFIHSWQLDYCPLAVEHSRSLMGTLASFLTSLKGITCTSCVKWVFCCCVVAMATLGDKLCWKLYIPTFLAWWLRSLLCRLHKKNERCPLRLTAEWVRYIY